MSLLPICINYGPNCFNFENVHVFFTTLGFYVWASLLAVIVERFMETSNCCGRVNGMGWDNNLGQVVSGRQTLYQEGHDVPPKG